MITPTRFWTESAASPLIALFAGCDAVDAASDPVPEKRIYYVVLGIRKMKAIVEAWWVMAFALFWVVVLPVAGLVEIGILVLDSIDRMTTHRVNSAA